MAKEQKNFFKIGIAFVIAIFGILSWTMFLSEAPPQKQAMSLPPAQQEVFLAAGPRIDSSSEPKQRSNSSKKIKPFIDHSYSKKEAPRAPASIELPSSNTMSSAILKTRETLKTQNENYNSKQVSIQGLVWTMQSSEQRANQSSSPMTSGIGIQGTVWSGNHGFEGRLKSGITNINSTADNNSQIKNVEGRYYLRRLLTELPFGIRETQFALFTGAELYRNSGSNFSNEYDLLKIGAAFEFPLLERWSGGGDIAMSLGPEKSTKQEIFGNIRYHYTRDWSMSLGYRMHLFTAGSKKASPSNTLPFREGYTEGYSALNFHF